MLIQLKKVDKIYRDGTVSFQALREVDLSVEEGEIHALGCREIHPAAHYRVCGYL